MDNRKTIVLTDFDGTISTMDVADTIFTVYLGDSWDVIDEQWHKGEISMVELYEKCWELTNIQEGELADFVDKIEIDEHFSEFSESLADAGIPMSLVSDGFDYYIERIMNKYGFNGCEYYANNLRYRNNEITLAFNNQNGECDRCANCKRYVIDNKRTEFDFVVYIGNGLSDLCASEHADLIFAKDSMLEHCVKNDIPHIAYETFGDIIKYFSENGLFKKVSS
jgi:2-hydroxy-3-keto-5-methylthiopentenyl-1-phosphate phosphatase